MEQRKITDDLQALHAVLPPLIAQAVEKADDSDNLRWVPARHSRGTGAAPPSFREGSRRG